MKQQKPKPSVETLHEYDELKAKLNEQGLLADELEQTINKLYVFYENYDFNNYEFEDPATGKKGVKDPAGKVLVPAEYDEFGYIGDPYSPTVSHIAAKKDDKWGIVSADGIATVLCEFRFDHLFWHPFTALYIACWDGVVDHFGFVTKTGEIFIPHVLTRLHEPDNDFMPLEGDGKFGAFDLRTARFLLPEYDRIDCGPEQNVLFVKDGVEGYVIEETDEFVPKQLFEADEDRYGDAYVYNTYLND